MGTRLFEEAGLDVNSFHGGTDRGPMVQFTIGGSYAQLDFAEVNRLVTQLRCWLPHEPVIQTDSHDFLCGGGNVGSVTPIGCKSNDLDLKPAIQLVQGEPQEYTCEDCGTVMTIEWPKEGGLKVEEK